VFKRITSHLQAPSVIIGPNNEIQFKMDLQS